MTTKLPAIVAKLPPPTALDVSRMQPSEIARHRAEILVSVEIFFFSYWRDDMPDALRAAVLSDWCDELEDWPVESIRAALRKHRRDHPNRRPNPGHIVAILSHAWGTRHAELVRAALAPPMQAQLERVSPEAAQRILEQVGGVPAKVFRIVSRSDDAPSLPATCDAAHDHDHGGAA